ncbi:hypothetical protein FGB62_200g011 [Gracilaria domingensis]|nr:hypothetical protein FGB62_200g011 [Gracilaria domingensis]
MLERFLQIRDQLIDVNEDEKFNLHVNGTVVFRNKVSRYARQLEETNYTTKYLQERKLSLANCRERLDMLIEDAATGFSNRESPFYRCFLQSKYITMHADILPDSLFESGVSCSRLLLPLEAQQSPLLVSEGTVSYADRLKRRNAQRVSNSQYRDPRFVLGSVAEVERLWSVADNILRNQRMSFRPLFFEAIIFLRVNSRLWDVNLVRSAYPLCRSREESQYPLLCLYKLLPEYPINGALHGGVCKLLSKHASPVAMLISIWCAA